MENIHIINTSSGNSYLYNLTKERLFLVSPDFQKYMNGELAISEVKSCEYYKKKLHYFKKHHILDKNVQKRDIASITPEMVEHSLSNTLQICFEVTDKCNLACTYCGYRNMYGGYDERIGTDLDIEKAKTVLDSMCILWSSNNGAFTQKAIDIAFYGGEPTLNMNFIIQIIDYVKSLKCTNRFFTFSMTTNALLLHKYMDFLAENEIRLLISLDGNEKGSIHRKDIHNNPTFERVTRNIDLLKKTYPEYFENYVRFNTVLHDKNPIKELYPFFKKRYGKAPRVSTLSASGRNKEYEALFKLMDRDFYTELNSLKSKKTIMKWMGIETPGYLDFIYFVYQSMGSVYNDYNELITENKHSSYLPTSTCLPFSRKVFVTVNSKLLPCERINQDYVLGYIGKEIDYNQIANKYNTLFNKIKKKCELCYRYKTCPVCLLSSEGKCNKKTNKVAFTKWIKHYVEVLEKRPEDYKRIKNQITII